MTTRQALAVLRRHAWLAAIVFVVIFAGAPTTVAFTIAFRTRDPETVARVANALATFYVEENAKSLCVRRAPPDSPVSTRN
jgi:uncharacterized protein involved in exopolysaccharide biosynthesis